MHCRPNHFATSSKTSVPPSLATALPGTATYRTLSQHIVSVFQEAYSAAVEVRYPSLIGVLDETARPSAALGVRRAAEGGSLFLERYLDQPAEVCLEKITGQRVSRSALAEVGNLASVGVNDISRLFYTLACRFEDEGIAYVLCTGTSLLRRGFNRMGLYSYVLADADPARLNGEASRWGTYYATGPKVLAGNVSDFRQKLELYNASTGLMH